MSLRHISAPGTRTSFIALLCLWTIFARGQETGKMAYHNIALKDFDGVRYELRDLVTHSRVTVLTFWASWCEPCQKELIELNRIAHTPSARGLSVVAINIDKNKDILAARRFLRARNIHVTVLSDEYAEAQNQYAVKTIPRLFIIDANGIVQGDHHGFKNIGAIEKEITRYFH
jgi:cytochrome c biogenesis protein CcmG, thiol:disulfide interchange protein DsbE